MIGVVGLVLYAIFEVYMAYQQGAAEEKQNNALILSVDTASDTLRRFG